jgi:hypothetical protein
MICHLDVRPGLFDFLGPAKVMECVKEIAALRFPARLKEKPQIFTVAKLCQKA